MITLDDNELIFRFDGIHPDAICKVSFQRTLRIPDNHTDYPLPAGLGLFNLKHIDDFANELPHALVRRGGVIMPMWQAEAMWLNFRSPYNQRGQYPFAIKIAAGKINAITGEAWREGLHDGPQDYIVVPTQPWLDGFCVKKGVIRQFVATGLGRGETVEEQITGQAENGGLQIVAYPMKRKVYEKLYKDRLEREIDESVVPPAILCSIDMGFAAGGKMRQEVYSDPHGLGVWDQTHSSRCFITVLNAPSWHTITGANPPSPPPSLLDYKEKGLPWFDYYAADQKPLEGSGILSRLKSFAHFNSTTKKQLPAVIVQPSSLNVRTIGPDRRPITAPDQVRESSF